MPARTGARVSGSRSVSPPEAVARAAPAGDPALATTGSALPSARVKDDRDSVVGGAGVASHRGTRRQPACGVDMAREREGAVERTFLWGREGAHSPLLHSLVFRLPLSDPSWACLPALPIPNPATTQRRERASLLIQFLPDSRQGRLQRKKKEETSSKKKMSTGDTGTLFERIGGMKTLVNGVDVFYDMILEDEMLAPFFEGVDQGRQRLKQVSGRASFFFFFFFFFQSKLRAPTVALGTGHEYLFSPRLVWQAIQAFTWGGG